VDARVLKPGDIKGLRIMSWYMLVGGGRVEELLPRLLRESSAAGMGLIVLLQETFRAGEAVPGSYPSEVKVPASVRPRRPTLDIRAIAEKFQMTMAYVPSMRNGPATSLAAREDRGNAVLSTERLTDITAIELPFGRERRVAVAAMVLPQSSSPRAGPLRVISAHFDPWDDRVAQSSALSERITYLTDVPIVIGGDLNAREGPHDGAVAALTSRIPLLSCGTGRTNRWPLRVYVLLPFVCRLDYMFATTATASGIQRTCETRSDAYGSDHLPLLLTMQY
jgi:endonuclease/exonuclease/phosphatase family metal-dependent hydrolase